MITIELTISVLTPSHVTVLDKLWVLRHGSKEKLVGIPVISK